MDEKKRFREEVYNRFNENSNVFATSMMSVVSAMTAAYGYITNTENIRISIADFVSVWQFHASDRDTAGIQGVEMLQFMEGMAASLHVSEHPLAESFPLSEEELRASLEIGYSITSEEDAQKHFQKSQENVLKIIHYLERNLTQEEMVELLSHVLLGMFINICYPEIDDVEKVDYLMQKTILLEADWGTFCVMEGGKNASKIMEANTQLERTIDFLRKNLDENRQYTKTDPASPGQVAVASATIRHPFTGEKMNVYFGLTPEETEIYLAGGQPAYELVNRKVEERLREDNLIPADSEVRFQHLNSQRGTPKQMFSEVEELQKWLEEED